MWAIRFGDQGWRWRTVRGLLVSVLALVSTVLTALVAELVPWRSAIAVAGAGEDRSTVGRHDDEDHDGLVYPKLRGAAPAAVHRHLKGGGDAASGIAGIVVACNHGATACYVAIAIFSLLGLAGLFVAYLYWWNARVGPSHSGMYSSDRTAVPQPQRRADVIDQLLGNDLTEEAIRQQRRQQRDQQLATVKQASRKICCCCSRREVQVAPGEEATQPY